MDDVKKCLLLNETPQKKASSDEKIVNAPSGENLYVDGTYLGNRLRSKKICSVAFQVTPSPTGCSKSLRRRRRVQQQKEFSQFRFD